MQIRNYKTSSEIRRVVKSLKTNLRFDKLRLASVRRSINIASLHESIEVDAARTPTKAPVKKLVKKPAAKVAPAKAAPSRSRMSDILTVRGPGTTTGKRPTAKPINNKNVEKLMTLLETRQDRLSVAQHIRQLLTHHFDKNDKTVLRLTKVVDALVSESENLFNETEKTLQGLATRGIDPAFQDTVTEIADALKTKFAKRYASFNIKYSMAVKPSAEKSKVDATKTYHIAYLMFDNLKGNTSTQDYVIAVTRISSLKEGDRTFIRAMTDYRPPTWLTKYSPGVEFTDTAKALRVVYNIMAMEDMAEVAEQTQVPFKQTDLKFKSKAVADTEIKDNKIVVTLKAGLSEEEAKKQLVQLFAEIRTLQRALHPIAYKRNPVKATEPKKVKRKIKTAKGVQTLEQYVVSFIFSKISGEDAPAQLPRNQIKEFMDKFEIEDENTVRDFNRLLRWHLGSK